MRAALTERQVAILVRILCRSIHHYSGAADAAGDGGGESNKTKTPKKKGKKAKKRAEDEDVMENLSVHLLKVRFGFAHNFCRLLLVAMRQNSPSP